MSNAAKLQVPGSSDNGKVPVYDLAGDQWDLAHPGVTNVRLAGGLAGNGTTNDAVGLQAVIDASSEGDTLYFDRLFGVAATIKIKAGRKYLGSVKDVTGIRQINGSNLDYIMCDEGWFNNATTMSRQYAMEDFQIDINKAGQASGTGIGLICMNSLALHKNCLFINYKDAGVKLSTQNRAGTTVSSVLSECRFWECQFRGNGTGQGIWQFDPSLSKCADGWVIGCAFAGGERGLYLNGGAAGWVVHACHFYAQRKDAIYAYAPTATTITGNYIEGWGYDHTTVVEKWAIGCDFANGPWPSTISGNNIIMIGTGTGGTQLGFVRGIQYYGVSGQPAKVTIAGNSLYMDGDGSASTGIWVESQGGGGTVDLAGLDTNLVYGWTTPFQLNNSVRANRPKVLTFDIGDETTTITTGVAKKTIRMPYAFFVTEVRASLNTVSSSGIPTVDINDGGTTILSTKLTIDASEKTSTTAATPAVISDNNLASDAEVTFDIDVAGTGAKGLKVTLMGFQL